MTAHLGHPTTPTYWKITLNDDKKGSKNDKIIRSMKVRNSVIIIIIKNE